MCADKMVLCNTVASRRWLYLKCFIVSVTGALSQRLCTNASGFIEGTDTEAYPVQYGDCSFAESLCNYTQFCTDREAENWRQNGDHAECPGKNGLYESFSVMLSPLLDISHVTCLTFKYTQELPGMLSVYLALIKSSITIMPEARIDIKSFVNFTTELPSTTGKLVFQARSSNTNYKVQLRGVKLQQGSCTGPDASLTQRMTGTIHSVSGLATYKPETTISSLQSTWSRSGEAITGYQSATSRQSKIEHNNNNPKTPIIAGVVVAVVIAIACMVALVIVVIRKRRGKQTKGKGKNNDTKVAGIVNDLHYESEDRLFGMTLVDIKEKPDVDPCEVADDGRPGLTRSAIIDNRGQIPSPEDKARSCFISQDSHKQKKEPSKLYSQVHKKRTETADVYSQIHKKNKETVNNSLEQASEAGDFISPLHTPKIFELSDPQRPLAMANTEDDQEYNALNFEPHRQVRKSSSPIEATRQTYDHILGNVLYDYAKVENNRHGANIVVDAEYNPLVT